MQNKVSTMKCLQDMGNNVQAYMSIPAEYEFDADTEPQEEVQSLCSVGRCMGVQREEVCID